MIGKNKAKKPDFNSLNNYLASNPKNNIAKKPISQKDKKKSDKKGLHNLEKITGSGDINIGGNQAILIYKKQSNNKKISKSPNPFNSKYSINKNKYEYVSDGGMSQKLQKYNSNNNFSPNNNNNNLYHYNNYI
jgi:hypothetical protein